jgi:hypothetical protein
MEYIAERAVGRRLVGLGTRIEAGIRTPFFVGNMKRHKLESLLPT